MYLLIGSRHRLFGSVLTELFLTLNRIEAPPFFVLRLNMDNYPLFDLKEVKSPAGQYPRGRQKLKREIKLLSQQKGFIGRHFSLRSPHGGLALIRKEQRATSPNRPKAGRRNGSRK